MSIIVDDRENLEPGAGITAAPAADGLVGLDTPDPFAGYEDYFGFDEIETWYFPDGKQWMKFKKLNEGDRAKYLRATRPDVTINQRSGDAKIPMDTANDRRELILASVVDWSIARRSPKNPSQFEMVPFSGQAQGSAVGQWLQKANPALVSKLEKAIRMANPWLMNEMSVEQIDKEIADLQELRKAAEEREVRDAAFQVAA